jgi:hypothetical protein
MINSIDKIIGYLLTMAIAAGVWLSFDNAPFATEITVYKASCPELRTKNLKCLKGEFPQAKETYRANSESQTVIYWQDGFAPQRLSGCAVRDSKNWSCTKHEDYTKNMVDGIFSDTSEFAGIYYQTSKLQWYKLWLKNYFFDSEN